ncbi:lytic polysaccharide monooxygenase [Streptomyces sp. SID8014]|uniref:lytic polysaccharide monooxygenase n=1 Tax=Streptomyces sp. SID8014 TaxID=2706097 RepID=UPI0013BCDB74|nr:lytic polysaccharide monooxygenase [Streptomyces sp. SID8014]NEC12854.1 lytic polysaccharide monooxygenase [Streptomyces sp. SID8014]
MTVRRTAARTAALLAAPLALTVLGASPAGAHGTMTDPVSRVSACYAEGPESPSSDACEAAVAASGAQAFYDWNEVNLPDVAGRHREVVPDGELCSAGRDKYRGLDLPRADWPSSPLSPGRHTFHYRATAPHAGTIELYLTKEGYDPTKPLAWSDLEEKPFATAEQPRATGGEYVFEGTVPERSGRHLVYSVWQRSDSPEAFYTCSDVVFGGGSAGAPAAEAPSERQIEAGAERSTVSHEGHGGDTARERAANAAHGEGHEAVGGGNAPEAKGAAEAAVEEKPAGGEDLAETGGDSATPYVAIGGAGVLALGAAFLFASARRRAVGSRH